MVVIPVERFELSLWTAVEVNPENKDEIIDRKGELFGIWACFADVASSLWAPPRKEQEKVVLEVDQSWLNFTNQQKSHEQKGRILA